MAARLDSSCRDFLNLHTSAYAFAGPATQPEVIFKSGSYNSGPPRLFSHSVSFLDLVPLCIQTSEAEKGDKMAQSPPTHCAQTF